MYRGTDAKLKFSELKDMMDAAYETAVEQAIEHAEENGYEWDGTLQDDWATFIDDIDDSISAKKAGMVRYIKEAEGDVAFLKKQKKELDARIKSIQTKAEGYTNYLDILQDGKPFECGDGVIKYSKSTTLEYSEGMKKMIKDGFVPIGWEEFAEVEQVVKIAKPAVKKYMKAQGITTMLDADIVTVNKIKIK